jgi:hypothetical protein
LINEASPRQLLRLRKDELVHLYVAAGLSDDPESFTKPELVEAIVASRDDIASLPPSSPPGRGGGNSSDYSSDDGNVAGDEETDDVGTMSHALPGLRRRATVNGMGQLTARALKARSLSLSQLNTYPPELSVAPKPRPDIDPAPRWAYSRVVDIISLNMFTDDETRARPRVVPLRRSVHPILFHHHLPHVFACARPLVGVLYHKLHQRKPGARPSKLSSVKMSKYVQLHRLAKKVNSRT